MNRCEKERQAEQCCDCPDRLSSDALVSMNHWQTQFEFQGWRLWYDTLEEPGEESRLCKVGRCRICGKCLCIGVKVSSDQSRDSILAEVYRHMYQLWTGTQATYVNFREVFSSVFHEEDQPIVRQWLSLPENQSVWQMYRHDVGGIK